MFHLDSCICVDFLRGNLPLSYQAFRRADPRLFALPAVVVAELRLGAEKSSRKDAMATTERLISEFSIVPFDDECATAYARLRANLERRGCAIGPNDMLIAATALTHEATLVTRNEQEFARVPGLRVEVWEDVVGTL